MAYLLAPIGQTQVERRSASGIIEVTWTFGGQIPDIVEIKSYPDGALVYAVATIDTTAKTPTSARFDVPAPTILTLAVCPRTVENGMLTDTMPDEDGVERPWETFAVVLSPLAVASGDGSAARPLPPSNLRFSTTDEGAVQVAWDAGESHRFNAKLEPHSAQFEIGGREREHPFERVMAGAYRFSIQRSAGNPAQWSDWVGIDVEVPLELGFQFWRPWFPIAPSWSFSQATPVTALARSTKNVDLFKVANTGVVCTAWWLDDGGGWREWYEIRPEWQFPVDAPLAAVSRIPKHLDLFLTASDGSIWSNWWNDDTRVWSSWFQIDAQRRFRKDQPVAAVSRTPEHLDLFAIGVDGAVWSSWWTSDGRGWRPWFPIRGEWRFPAEARVTAVSRSQQHLDLFTIDNHGKVWTCWWFEPNARWGDWSQIHPQTRFARDKRVAAVSRGVDHLDLFVVRDDGAVMTSWWFRDEQGWRAWSQVGDKRFGPDAHVTAITRPARARGQRIIELFVTGPGGVVWTVRWDRSWGQWTAVRPGIEFDQGHPVAAVSRVPQHIDLFKVGPNGVVQSAWWEPS